MTVLADGVRLVFVAVTIHSPQLDPFLLRNVTAAAVMGSF